MLHIIVSTIFVAAGAFALAMIVAMLFDAAPRIVQALGIGHRFTVAPLPARRVRVVRMRRLSPRLPAPLRAAA